MNDPGHPTDARWQLMLRGLPKEATPAHDLWPAIARRIGEASRDAGGRRSWRFARQMAMAASLLVVAGIVWKLQLRPVPQSVSQPAAAGALQLQQERMLTAEYRAALLELSVQQVPASFRPGLQALDHSADQLRSALQHAPDSRLLLQQLRSVYSRRLSLARRAIHA